jgi:Tfp pilus assembly protein PilE
MPGWLKALLIVAAVVVLLIVAVIGILIGSASYGWKAAVRAGNEAATLQDLKTIAAVEIQYYNTHNRTFGTFDQMIKERMLTSKFSENPPAADGYVFKSNITPKTSSQPTSYTLNADPQSAATGKNHFYIDSNSSMIHFNPDGPASANDPAPGE